MTEFNRVIDGIDPKPWWQSATIWGALAVVASQGAALVGYQLDAAQVSGLLTDLMGLAGGVLALWGRARAVRPVKLR